MAVCLEERRSSQHQMESRRRCGANKRRRKAVAQARVQGLFRTATRGWASLGGLQLRPGGVVEDGSGSGGVGLNELQTSSPAKKKKKTHSGIQTNKQRDKDGRDMSRSRGLTAVFNDGVWTLQHRYLLAVTAAAAISTCQSSCIKNVIKNHSNHS